MSINTQSLQPVINFLWTVADDVLVNTYQKGKYKDVILPMVVIRRLDLLLEPTKEQVLKTFNEYKAKLQNLDSLLTNSKHGSGLAFYNTSKFTLKKLLDDPKNLSSNFENYLNGFSENVQDIIKQFKFRNEIETLDEADILFSLIEKFCSPKVELHPDKLPPLAMGYVYEDLVRRFNEENEYSKVFDNADFGYAQITVNRPLKDEKGKDEKDAKGKPKPDPKLKDSENIPLKEDIQEFFEREVLPFAPDSWWDKKDTKIGYEINFAKYFYKHQPPKSLKDIAADILAIEEETEGLLKEIIE